MAQKILGLLKIYIPLLPVLLIGLWLAHENAFMQDDAYISYNYAKWFSRGYGLVWYPGSTEFGYTNFLYTFMIGVAMLFRIDPETASNCINVVSFIGCLIVGYAIAIRVIKHRGLALLPMLLLATHHTFTAYATGGLETMWVTLLVTTFYWQILALPEQPQDEHYFRLGTLAAIALLSRLDTALLLFPGYGFVLLAGMRRRNLRALIVQLLRMRHAIIIPVVVVIGFMLCCFLAYGYTLPTSFYVKMPGEDNLVKYGLHYLVLYNMLHLYLPFMVPAVVMYFFLRRRHIRKFGQGFFLLLAVLAVWLAYLVYVGGDFMEFRFLVPVLLFYHLLLFRLLIVLFPVRGTWVSLAVYFAFLAGNFLHAELFVSKPGIPDFNQIPKRFEYAFVESTDTLEDWISAPNANWRLVGMRLHELFYRGSHDDVKIAVGNAGLIPYFSDLPAFDVLGLNSRATIRNHNNSKLRAYYYEIDRPGHKMVASDDLLVKYAVTLNFAFPQAMCKEHERYIFSPNEATLFPFTRHETLFIPLNNGCFAVADYVTPHPEIEEMLANKTIIRYRDVKSVTACPDWLCLE